MKLKDLSDKTDMLPSCTRACKHSFCDVTMATQINMAKQTLHDAKIKHWSGMHVLALGQGKPSARLYGYGDM